MKETIDTTGWVDFEGMPMPPALAERLMKEREGRAAEVLDLVSSAAEGLRYGFPEAAFGPDKPGMMGVVFAEREAAEGETKEWKHVPATRLHEVLTGDHTVEYSGDPGKMVAKITRGDKSWEMPARRWEMIFNNSYAASLYRVTHGILAPTPPHLASIKSIDLGPNQYARKA